MKSLIIINKTYLDCFVNCVKHSSGAVDIPVGLPLLDQYGEDKQEPVDSDDSGDMSGKNSRGRALFTIWMLISIPYVSGKGFYLCAPRRTLLKTVRPGGSQCTPQCICIIKS